MSINEVNGDLFDAPLSCYLAHCISGDYALGAGIAKKFDEVYDMRNKLHRNFPIPLGGKFANVGSALLIDNVFNLVTKPRYYHKPTYNTLRETLEEMKNYCEQLGISKVSMPKIGCGLDKLNWDEVKKIIKQVFKDSDVEITVYVL